MKELPLLFVFCLAQLSDIVTTKLALEHFLGMHEANLAFAHLAASGRMDEVYLIKLEIIILLSAAYLLSKRVGTRVMWRFSLEKSLQIGSILTWGVVSWNLTTILSSIQS